MADIWSQTLFTDPYFLDQLWGALRITFIDHTLQCSSPNSNKTRNLIPFPGHN